MNEFEKVSNEVSGENSFEILDVGFTIAGFRRGVVHDADLDSVSQSGRGGQAQRQYEYQGNQFLHGIFLHISVLAFLPSGYIVEKIPCGENAEDFDFGLF